MLKMVELKAYFLWELEPEPEKKKKTRSRSKMDQPRNTGHARWTSARIVALAHANQKSTKSKSKKRRRLRRWHVGTNTVPSKFPKDWEHFSSLNFELNPITFTNEYKFCL